MFPKPPRLAMAAQRGSAIMIALFVIVIMGLLAAAMGRFLLDSSEKNTLEVRSVRALMAAQSGLEIGLYRLYPNDHWDAQQCAALTTIPFAVPGLVDCNVVLTCKPVVVSAAGGTQTGYSFQSTGACGHSDVNSSNPDFAVSRTLVAEAFDGVMP